MSKNRVIGNQGQIPWRISEDLTLFANLTKGHPVIMGRKTYESLSSPLKDRTVIVVSKSLNSTLLLKRHNNLFESKRERVVTAALPPSQVIPEDGAENTIVDSENTFFADSLNKALDLAKNTGGSQEIFIAGGGQIYSQCMSLAGKIYLTVVDAEVRGDTFFPEFNTHDWELIKSRKRFAQVLNQSVVYSFEEWVRR